MRLAQSFDDMPARNDDSLGVSTKPRAGNRDGRFPKPGFYNGYNRNGCFFHCIIDASRPAGITHNRLTLTQKCAASVPANDPGVKAIVSDGRLPTDGRLTLPVSDHAIRIT